MPHNPPRVEHSGASLFLSCDFADREKARQIPGARWHATRRAWCVAATPAIARHIRARFPLVEGDDSFRALLSQSEQVAEIQQIRAAEDLEAPPTLRTKPWRHQTRAYHFAKAHAASLNAMVMGTGKSLPIVALASEQQATIILCPARVVSVWPREFAKHCAVPVHVAALTKGDTKRKAKDLTREAAVAAAKGLPFIVVVNYESAWRGADERDGLGYLLLHAQWDLAVLDESHRIKAPGGRQSLFCARLGRAAKKRICLTGTPTPHNPLDIWAQFRFLDHGILGTSFHQFRTHYEITPPSRPGAPAWVAKQVVGYKNLDELTARIQPYVFRVGQEVLDLPEAVHATVTCDLSKDAAIAYTKMATEMIAGIRGGLVTASNAMVKLLRLQQITGGAIKLDDGQVVEIDDAKRALLEDLMEDIGKDESIVVFCRFHHDLDAVHRAAANAGRVSLELSGRVDSLKAWQESPQPMVLAVQIASGGVGVDLTKARYSVFYSLSHSLGEYDQALARCHRPGQTRSVNHIHLVAAGTIDEDIYEALEKRREVVDYVIEKLKGEANERAA